MLIFFSHRASSQSFSQFYLSEVWDEEGGAMPVFYRNSSTTDAQNNVYVVGSTTNAFSSNDILVQKFSQEGELLWEHSFDGGANLQDMATGLFVDDSNNVYITGAATQNSQNNLDLVVLKYNSNGSLLWTYYYNFGGSPIPHDAGTSITGDNDGGIYVTGTSSGNGTMMDYSTLKLKDNGTLLWSNRYDYTQYNEVPNKISFAGGQVFVTGASQMSLAPNKWELATVFYNSNNGNINGVKRSGGSSIEGVNEANDLILDDQGNIYVLGATKNQATGFDMSLYKLNNDLDIVWEQHFDGYGNDDKGSGLKMDSLGNIYAVGSVNNPTQGKNYSILKYDSLGVLQWSREFNGLANQDDEAVQLVVREDRIFVTGAARNDTNSEIVTMGYTADGDIFSVKTFDSPFGLGDKPTAMGIDLDNNLIIVGQIKETDTTFRNVTFKYNVMEKPIVPVYVDSVPAYNARELIVRFDKTAMNLDAVDKKNFDAGLLKDFVHEHVIDSLNEKFPFDAGRLHTFKIFHRMTTADSLSITRLGDTIPVPDFWATLSVMLPEEFDEFEAIDTLNTMKPMVHYGEVNGFIRAASVPDDQFYSTVQKSLHPLLTPTPNPNNDDLVNHINIEGAWDLVVGNPNVKVGVFDEAIFWQHEDFYTNETQANQGLFSQSKIKGGYHFYNAGQPSGPIPIQNYSSPQHSHGTAVAGIIGSVRNNDIGIAGIAGGDVTQIIDGQPNTGVSLYSYGILLDNIIPSIGLLTEAYSAIAQASLNTTVGFGDGIHIQNHSWLTFDPVLKPTLRLVLREAWRNQALIVAARGNNGLEADLTSSIRYPACVDDLMVLNVGASGTDGKRIKVVDGATINDSEQWAPAYGQGMDFLAPGTSLLVAAPNMPNDHFFSNQNLQYGPNYGAFNGTSASAPHVSGVAALMYSLHTAPNNLTGEDIEHILQKTTHLSQNHSSSSHYEIFTSSEGFGIINAALAVEMVEYPNYFVRHSVPSDVVSTSVTYIGESSISIDAQSHYSNLLNPGTYIADRYEATWTIQVELPSNHEIIDFWPLFSKSCAGFRHTSDWQYSYEHYEHFAFEPSLYDIYNQEENIGFGTNTLNTITVKATYYFVKYKQFEENFPINKWLPECGTSNPNQLIPFSFSLHIRENNELSTQENQANELQLFPNPADNSITLKLTNQPIERITVFDLQGRIVYLHELESSSNRFDIDLGSFNSGLYIVQVESIDGIVSSSKFVKK